MSSCYPQKIKNPSYFTNLDDVCRVITSNYDKSSSFDWCLQQ